MGAGASTSGHLAAEVAGKVLKKAKSGFLRMMDSGPHVADYYQAKQQELERSAESEEPEQLGWDIEVVNSRPTDRGVLGRDGDCVFAEANYVTPQPRRGSDDGAKSVKERVAEVLTPRLRIFFPRGYSSWMGTISQSDIGHSTPGRRPSLAIKLAWAKAVSSGRRLRQAGDGLPAKGRLKKQSLKRLPSNVATKLPLMSRAVNLHWLILFAGTAVDIFSDDELFSTHDLVTKVILPHTTEARSSYAELDHVEIAGAGADDATYFVAHSWDQPFPEVVRCLAQRFAGREATTGIMLSALSFNLHEPPPASSSYHRDMMRALTEETAGTVLVLDQQGSCLRSLMCVAAVQGAVQAQGTAAGYSGNRAIHVHTLEILPYALEDSAPNHIASPRLESALESVGQALLEVDVAACQSSREISQGAVLEHLTDNSISPDTYNSEVRDAVVEALGRLADSRGAHSAEAAQVQYISAFLLNRCGCSVEAEALCLKAVDTLMFLRGSFYLETNRGKELLGLCRMSNGNFLGAIDVLRAAVREYRHSYGPCGIKTVVCMRELASAYHEQGQLGDAEKWYNKAAAACAQTEGQEFLAEVMLIRSRLKQMSAQGHGLDRMTHLLHDYMMPLAGATERQTESQEAAT